MTDEDKLIERIDMEYDLTEGFLGRLREGTFDPVGAQRLLGLLAALDLGDGPVDRRLVQLLWYMPLLMEWQKPRLSADDAAAVEQTLNKVISTLERVLGVP